MSCVIFDGKAFAKEKEQELQGRVRDAQSAGKISAVKTITFDEDAGSRLYTKLKSEAAKRVGIRYTAEEFSLQENTGLIIQHIREMSFDPSITGIMIQKPAKSVWIEETRQDPSSFDRWWEELTNAIDPKKDVDCLTQYNLNLIFNSQFSTLNSLLLPATVRAVLSILENAQEVLGVPSDEWLAKKVLILGKSDIVGKPLTHVLRMMGHSVSNVGRRELPTVNPKEYAIVISAAGSPNVVTGDMVRDGAVVIDVGSPTNDVERSTVEKKAAFLTPVPGGVGPVTVVSLMENILSVASQMYA